MKAFLADLGHFKASLRQDSYPDAAIEEVLAWFRECWKDERQEWVRWYVKQEADFQRELLAMAGGINERKGVTCK